MGGGITGAASRRAGGGPKLIDGGAKATPWIVSAGVPADAIATAGIGAGSTGVTRGSGGAARGFFAGTTGAFTAAVNAANVPTEAAAGRAALASKRIDIRCGFAAFGTGAGCHAIATKEACAATIAATIPP